MLGRIFNTVRRGVGRTLQVGGHALRNIASIGGSATKTIADWGVTPIAGLGRGLRDIGYPNIGEGLVKVSNTADKITKSKPVNNVVRAFDDVGKTFERGGDILRR